MVSKPTQVSLASHIKINIWNVILTENNKFSLTSFKL